MQNRAMSDCTKEKNAVGFACGVHTLPVLLGQLLQLLKELQILPADFQIGTEGSAVRLRDLEFQNRPFVNPVLHDRIQEQRKLRVRGPEAVPGGFHFQKLHWIHR